MAAYLFHASCGRFGVNYVGKEHAYHLIKCIKENYDVTEDWEGECYLGLTFDWNYDTRSVHFSMPNYIPDPLKRFKRENPKKLIEHCNLR